jgi:hypothetical protein
MKKMAMVLLCVVVLSALAIGSESNATPTYPGWYNVTLVSAGALPTYNFYFLFATSSDASWTGNRVFLIDASNPATKAALAAALTAYSSSGQASLYMPTSIEPNTFVEGVVAGTLD